MVPLRAIAEGLGFSVTWNAEDASILLEKDGKVIVLQIGNKKLFKGDEVKELSVAPVVEADRTLVPLRAVAESFDMNVDWNGEEKLVSLTSQNKN